MALLLLVAVYACAAGGQVAPSTPTQTGAGGDDVTLTVEVTPTSGSVRLSRRKVLVVLTNHTSAPLVLDRRHLFEGVMVRLWDRNKKRVGKIPLSPPRPPEDGDQLIVAAGAEYKVRFELGWLYEEEILDTLNTGPYTLEVCYRNTVPAELDGVEFSLLVICAEPATLQ